MIFPSSGVSLMNIVTLAVLVLPVIDDRATA
jgi:hypothetical protein